MKRWILVAILSAVIIWLVYDRFHQAAMPPPEDHASPKPTTIDVSDVIEYVEYGASTYRVRTARDVLPGGLSAAMAPALVDWDNSDFSGEGWITIRNLNHGGNPISGVTVLRTARVRPARIERAEFITVPLGGPRAISHGQIRFVFGDGGVELLEDGTDAVGEPDSLTDLVVSWEAWRPPGVDYGVMRGMDPEVYQLTMRAYSGPQRFLEDALMGRDWYVYTLDLPGGRAGNEELLKVSLAMGDGAARSVIARFLDRAEQEWAASGPDSDEEGGIALEVWRRIREQIGGARTDGDERIDLTERAGYQSLLRSCATMALYAVNVTTARLIERGYPAEGKRPTSDPELPDEPEWLVGLAKANIAEVFLRAPQTIAFVRKYPTSIPGLIPRALGDAGLIVQQDGKNVERHYSLKDMTPWGPRDHLLIR